MRRTFFIVLPLLALCLLAAALIWIGRSRPSSASSDRLEWDLTETNHMSAVGLDVVPADRFHLQLDGRLELKLPEPLSFSGQVHRIFVRVSRNEQIEMIELHLEQQTADEAYATAREMVERWQLTRMSSVDIARADLDRWLSETHLPNFEKFSAIALEHIPNVYVEIMPTWNDSRPYYIIIQYGWPDPNLLSE